MKKSILSKLLAFVLAAVMVLGTCASASADITYAAYNAALKKAADELYENLMACETMEEFSILLTSHTDDNLFAMCNVWDAEQVDTVMAHQDALLLDYQQRLAAGYEVSLQPSEIVYLTRDFTLAVPMFERIPVAATYGVARGLDTDDGIELVKYLSEDGSKIYLEAWATGSTQTIVQTTTKPTDIIIVVDQSGSMAYDFKTTTFRLYANSINSSNYTRYQAGNLYHKLSDDSYVKVTVTKEPVTTDTTYTAISSQKYNYNYYNNYRENLYRLVNGKYEKVEVTVTGNYYNRTYIYTFIDGTSVRSQNWDGQPKINDTPIQFYTLNEEITEYKYVYSYNAVDGTKVQIGEPSTANADLAYHSVTFYEEVEVAGNTRRLDALVNALDTFISNVETNAKGENGQFDPADSEDNDDIDHRIAIVGFTNGGDNNDELLTGVTISTGNGMSNGNSSYFPTGYEKNGVQWGNISNQQYANALQDMTTEAGRTSVNNAVDALTAYGGTEPHRGLSMAQSIYDNDPQKTDALAGKRNRVVILFCDGQPDNKSLAQSAIDYSNELKSDSYKAKVYSVGIFEGADATSAGDLSEDEDTAAYGNYFMQQVSSNNGTPKSPGYYLSAGNSSALNRVFQQISSNIETGGSTTTLTSTAVLKDVISDYFELPEGANASSIKLYTEDSADGEFGVNDPVTFNGTVTLSEDKKTIQVTGFDYSANWVGTDTAADGTVKPHDGKKLIVEIPIVTREGFLGGNGVPTNGTGTGLYQNADSTLPTATVTSPTKDVEIPAVTITVTDKNVYLLGDLTTAQLLDEATMTCGNVTINLNTTEVNYGLQAWQNAYVDITTPNSTNSFTDMTGDSTFTVSGKVAPKSTDGTVTEKSATDDGNVYVFLPYLEYKDSAEKYHSVHTFPTYFAANNLVGAGVTWKHVDANTGTTTLDTELDEMDSAEPEVELNYTYSSDDIDSTGKIIEKEYIPVQVTIELDDVSSIKQTVIENGEEKEVYKSLTDFVTFTHSCDCKPEELEASPNGACQWTEPTVNGNPAFLIHVYDVDGVIKITKNFVDQAGAAVETDESALFTVKDSNNKVLWTVVITGNSSEYIVGVPVGTYTVTENSDWTIRYNPTADQQRTVTIVGGETVNKPAAVEFTNTLVDKWLIDESGQNNVFKAEKLEVSNDEAQ